MTHMALRSLQHHGLRSIILALCIGITITLPLLSRLLVQKYERELTARADATPLVLGAKGNRFDLVLAGLYFRRGGHESIKMQDYREFVAETSSFGSDVAGTPVPLHLRFTARGTPLIATTPEYFEQRRSMLARGEFPARIGEAVLGWRVAGSMRLAVGEYIFTDQLDSFDITKPPALKMLIVGILAPSNSADDLAVFTDLKTAWVLEGVSHGHADPETGIPEQLILSRDQKAVSISEELIEYNQVTPENASTFHLHGGDSSLSISAVLFFPFDTKSATIAKARVNASPALQMLVPREVIDELLSYVFRIRMLIDALFVVMSICTAALMTLLFTLSARVRVREFETLHKIGVPRWFVASLFSLEMGVIVLLGAVSGVGIAAGTYLLVPDVAGAISANFFQAP